MIWADGRFWAAHIEWYVRSDHRWDVALHYEAMNLKIESVGRAISEALAPAIERAVAQMREFMERRP